MKSYVALLLTLLAGVGPLSAQIKGAARFSVVEATIAEMQAAMKEGRVTSRELVL
jgi:hypothetical protein